MALGLASWISEYLSMLPRRLAERGSRTSQGCLNSSRGRVRPTKYAPRDPCRVLERRHGLAEIVERASGVCVERLSVRPAHPERGVITISENAPRHGNRFA